MKQEVTYFCADIAELINADLRAKGLEPIVRAWLSEIVKEDDRKFKVTLSVTDTLASPLPKHSFTDSTNLNKLDAKELFAMYGWREAEPIPTPKKRKK